MTNWDAFKALRRAIRVECCECCFMLAFRLARPIKDTADGQRIIEAVGAYFRRVVTELVTELTDVSS